MLEKMLKQCLVVMVVVTIGNAAKADYFVSNFDDGVWDPGWVGAGSVSVSSANAYEGGYSLAFGKGGYVNRSVSGTGELGVLTEYFYVKNDVLDMGFQVINATNGNSGESIFFRNLVWDPPAYNPTQPTQYWHFSDGAGVDQYYLFTPGWHKIELQITATGYTFQVDENATLTGMVMTSGVTNFQIGDVWWAGVGCDGTYVDDIAWQAVPEPGTAALVILGGLSMLCRRARDKRYI